MVYADSSKRKVILHCQMDIDNIRYYSHLNSFISLTRLSIYSVPPNWKQMHISMCLHMCEHMGVCIYIHTYMLYWLYAYIWTRKLFLFTLYFTCLGLMIIKITNIVYKIKLLEIIQFYENLEKHFAVYYTIH